MPFRAVLARRMLLPLVAVLALGLVACGGGDETDDADTPAAGETTAGEETPEASGEITVNATEYAFDLPETLPAGETTFTLNNVGEEKHFIEILELKADAPPVDELVKIKRADKFFVRRVGGTKPIGPGEQAEPFTGELTPGRYGYACFFATKKGPPHAFLGMAGEFTVE